MYLSLILFSVLFLGTEPSKQSALNDGRSPVQKWAYAEVRPGAHMFWWLFQSTHSDGYSKRPTVLWLQGGPGASSTGYGNFEIIGPFDTDLQRRNISWVSEANLLFVDNPVGSGYSYCSVSNCFARNTDQIADDLFKMLVKFYEQNSELRRSPLYIFGQSYGGKMGIVFGKKLYNEIRNGNIVSNLGGVAMGNSWIDPVESTVTWGNTLHWMGIVDTPGLKAIDSAANDCKAAADSGSWELSTALWSRTQSVVSARSNYINFYNILEYRTFSSNNVWYDFLIRPQATDLDTLMNGRIKKYLGIIPPTVRWGAQSGAVFQANTADFMKPVVNEVDELTANTNLSIIVYQGQLDLICDTKGAMNFVQKMKWNELPSFNRANRRAIEHDVTSQTIYYVKSHKNFKFYWINKAGHAVPKDQRSSALLMLKDIIQ